MSGGLSPNQGKGREREKENTPSPKGLITGDAIKLENGSMMRITYIPPQTDIHLSRASQDVAIEELVAWYNNSGNRNYYEQTLTAIDSQRLIDAPLLRSPQEVRQRLATLTTDEREQLGDIPADAIEGTVMRIQVLEELSSRLDDVLSKAVKVSPAIVRSLMIEDSLPKRSDLESLSGRLLAAIIRFVPVGMVQSSLVKRYQGENLFRVENRARLAVNAQTKLDNLVLFTLHNDL